MGYTAGNQLHAQPCSVVIPQKLSPPKITNLSAVLWEHISQHHHHFHAKYKPPSPLAWTASVVFYMAHPHLLLGLSLFFNITERAWNADRIINHFCLKPFFPTLCSSHITGFYVSTSYLPRAVAHTPASVSKVPPHPQHTYVPLHHSCLLVFLILAQISLLQRNLPWHFR